MGTPTEISFFEQALNFGKLWSIKDLDFEKSKNEVHIHLEYVDLEYVSEETGEVFNLYDLRLERRWQHLPILQYKCFIYCCIPRYLDSNKKVKSIPVPWASSHQSYTYLFHNYVVDLLLGSHNQTKTAQLAKTTFPIVNRIMHSSVDRGMAKREIRKDMTVLGIDEKSISSGHNYATLLVDTEEATVLDLCENRDKKAVKQLITETLNESLLENIKSVSMDMWESFMLAVKEEIPKADIVHDKFHIVKYLNEAVDMCRKKEVNSVQLLKKSRFVMLKNSCNRTAHQQEHFEQIMDANLLTAQAWALSEQFKNTVLEEKEIVKATAYFDMWTEHAQESLIKSVIKLANTLGSHKEGIINYVKHKITNAVVERINGKIQNIKNVGRGYRTFKNLRSAVLFFNGGLDLYSHKF